MSNDSHDELDELEPIGDDSAQVPPTAPASEAFPAGAEAARASEPAAPAAIPAHEAQMHQLNYLGKLVDRSFAGMPAPLFNPSASKEYYRFFFGGLMILLGCLMPFDADWAHLGFRTFFGAICFLIGLGICWSMWGAINTGIVRMKWILLAVIPFVYGVLFVINPFPQAEVNGRTEMDIMRPYYEAEAETFTQGQVNQLQEQRRELRVQDPRVNTWGEFGSTLGRIMLDPSATANALQRSGPGKWFVLFGSLLIEFTFILSIFGGAKKIKEQKAARVASSRRR